MFNLADYVQVKQASIQHGLLVIDLEREVLESVKPRRISIVGAGNDNRKTETSQAA